MERDRETAEPQLTPGAARPAARRGGHADLLRLQSAAGNHAFARAVGPAIQRQITVDGEPYDYDGAREFRRTLMLKLKATGYTETGTKKMWAQVDELLKTGDHTFGDWDALVWKLVEVGLLDKALPSSGFPTGPTRLGVRPKWSSETAAAIAKARGDKKGLAARHVLASSTLGRAVERAEGSLMVLNKWLLSHGGAEQTNETAARKAIWGIVHNFGGNLWMGETQANTAIGFIRGTLRSIKAKLPLTSSGTVDVAQLQGFVRGSMVTGGQDNERNRVWNLLLGDLAVELGEFGQFGAKADVEDLIDEYDRNADIDPPALRDDEYDHIVKVWWLIQNPKTALEGLSLFMTRPLKGSITPPG